MTILKNKSTRLVVAGTSAAAVAALLAAGMAPAQAAAGSAGTVTSTKATGTWSVQDLAATAIGTDMACASIDEMAGALLFISEPGAETPAVANATTEARSVYPLTLDPLNQMSLDADGFLADSSTLDGGFVGQDGQSIADLAAAVQANHTYSIGYACTELSGDFTKATIDPVEGQAVASWAKLTTDASKNWTISTADARFAGVAAPTVSGTAAVGRVLTATVAAASPAADSTTLQWLRNGAAISGATKSSYTPVAADLGKKISVRATHTKAGYLDASAVSTATAAVAAGTFSTVPTPKISGTAAVGYTLKASVGTASPAATVKYQWLRDGKTISGATKSSYTLTKSDKGRKVTVRATFSRDGYAAATKTSASKTGLGVFTGLKKPSVAGVARVGQTVKASVTTPTPKPSATKYQWLRNGKAITGATKVSYKLTSKDRGKQIAVKVSFSRSGYLTAGTTSGSKTVR